MVDAIPLTVEGWVDLERLPFPNQRPPLTLPIAIFHNDLEQKLMAIWQNLFNLSTIDIQDNFFDLGGDSLLAVRLFARIEQEFGKKLPLSVLLQSPTIKQLAVLLSQEDIGDVWSPLVVIQAGNPSKPPLFCIHGMGFNVLIYRNLAANLDPEQPVYGLQARGLDGDKDRISDRLEEIAADYIKQVQTVQPHGPYRLAGLSNGGNIALEMAQQFLAQGQEVALVAMFDTFGPDSIQLLPSLPRFLSSLKYLARFGLHRFVWKSLQNPTVALTEIQKMASLVRSAARDLPIDEATEKLRKAQQSKRPDSQPVRQLNLVEHWMDWFSQRVLEHSPWAFLPKHLLKDVGGSLSETIKEMEETYSKIQAVYQPSAYPGKIVLFRASESPPGYQLDPLLGWGDIAQDGVEIHIIPGNHTSILESKALAKKIDSYLNR
nr:non-ribosomal peptide synthetase [Leptolyngbya sp. 7M]